MLLLTWSSLLSSFFLSKSSTVNTFAATVAPHPSRSKLATPLEKSLRTHPHRSNVRQLPRSSRPRFRRRAQAHWQAILHQQRCLVVRVEARAGGGRSAGRKQAGGIQRVRSVGNDRRHRRRRDEESSDGGNALYSHEGIFAGRSKKVCDFVFANFLGLWI